MELLDQSSTAPALERGMEVMRLLSTGKLMSLETIGKELNFPRSSLLRILSTLQNGHWIARDEQRRYRALMGLHPLKGDQTRDWSQHRNKVLTELGDSLALTVEWFEIENEVARINWRHEPEGREVKVVARIGFSRYLSGEIDAVARLLLLNTNNNIGPHAWVYKNGNEKKIKKKDLKSLPKAEGEADLFYDSEYNTNGVRRIACAIPGTEGHPAAIVSLAESFTPKAKQMLPERISKLRKAQQDLTNF